MTQITTLLFWITSAFLVPVIVGLLYFFLRSLYLLAGFCGQYVRRTRAGIRTGEWLQRQTQNPCEELPQEMKPYEKQPLVRTALQIVRAKGCRPRVNKALADYELQAEKEIGKARMLVKFGPILGLMGTLIPMGPALAGLASGDVSAMAYNMQMAFATTVIGLFCGATGFVLLQTSQRMAHSDLAQLDYLADMLTQRQTPAETEEGGRL